MPGDTRLQNNAYKGNMVRVGQIFNTVRKPYMTVCMIISLL